MSSVLKGLLYVSPLIISAAALAVTLSPTYPTPSSGAAAAPSATPPRPQTLAPAPVVNALSGAVMQWDRLRQSDAYSFEDYAAFLIAHPGWPGEARMRRLAESKADPTKVSPSLIVNFFNRFPPRGADARARHADALLIIGREPDAAQAARAAWTTGTLPPDGEARLLARFGSMLTSTDQDQRMEQLLAVGSTTAATRQITLTSSARQPVYRARLAMQTRSIDAPALVDAIGNSAMADPGFLIDKARWLNDTGRWMEARELLAKPMKLASLPLNPEKWLEVLLGFARSASNDNQGSIALGIALNADQAFAPGTDIRREPLGVRDDYTSLVWLGGQSALRQLIRPADAVGMFDRYARAAQTPQTQTKGWYWAGRAALAAGDKVRADTYFTTAGQYGDQFYGQLAAERLGRPAGIVTLAPPVAITGQARAAFEAREVVQVARLLGNQGRWQDQTQFLRAIAQTVDTDVDHSLAAELARSIGRPDLGVMVARNWRNSGGSDPLSVGFPQVTVPGPQQSQWTIIHAITRQESQFDRQIVSSAGARGLMQLMPGTARETAGKLGMSYDFDRLTSDPAYNILLGSAFFARMLDNYGGNHVLAVAAYNAGPGNVRKWLATNGDPRMPGVDVIEWIEAIPFTETRGYVQRVLENAVVYDWLNPSRPPLLSQQHRLSGYLGKNTPG